MYLSVTLTASPIPSKSLSTSRAVYPFAYIIDIDETPQIVSDKKKLEKYVRYPD
jgi:hypothetical protein